MPRHPPPMNTCENVQTKERETHAPKAKKRKSMSMLEISDPFPPLHDGQRKRCFFSPSAALIDMPDGVSMIKSG
jgi:hypothetical protein